MFIFPFIHLLFVFYLFVFIIFFSFVPVFRDVFFSLIPHILLVILCVCVFLFFSSSFFSVFLQFHSAVLIYSSLFIRLILTVFLSYCLIFQCFTFLSCILLCFSLFIRFFNVYFPFIQPFLFFFHLVFFQSFSFLSSVIFFERFSFTFVHFFKRFFYSSFSVPQRRNSMHLLSLAFESWTQKQEEILVRRLYYANIF